MRAMRATRAPGRLARLAPPVARLSLFALVVAAGLQLLAGKLGRDQVDGALLDLGAGLVQLAGPGDGQARALELNGSRLYFETTTRAAEVTAVLDDAEVGCSGRASGFQRAGDGGRGYVACLGQLTSDELAATGELAVRGAPGYRYVYAQRGAERTRVVRFWTDRPVDLERLFPARGDAPGRDAVGVPRPPGARRILSAREVGAPQEITLYVDPRGESDELERWYRGELAGLGWQPVVAPPGPPPPASADRVLMARRAGDLAALVFAGDGAGGRSVAILTSL